jgi:hypothetical protein
MPGPRTEQASPDAGDHLLEGPAEMRRVGRVRFPVFAFTQGEKVLASLGRSGWFTIFFGRGQRVELSDGSRWRITSKAVGGMVCPAIIDAGGRKIAVSALTAGTYGINGRDYGCVFYRAGGRRFGRGCRWLLRSHEDELAAITSRPYTVDAAQPVHLGAVLLSFTLANYGILGESMQRLNFRWSS